MALQSPPAASNAYPFSALFVPFPFVCFTLVLLTDILYWRTSNLMWSNFSDWLLFFGLIVGAISLIAGLIDLIRPATRALRPPLSAVVVYIGVLLLGILNSFIHAGDGWTAIVPAGLIASAVTLLAMIASVYLTAGTRTANAWRIP
ncbi:DUF2231 domain-containing protein [Rhizobium wuzhouense]|uniref:DUF2231 domain-containing protein n=1 Tax=Rhizobium wuzhouense TaxID=1986026 RepID=A0ABX5NPZ5_9HYPH|nr:DUF2231 domain-containing protein [Rhizobium wuzhouense]PYB71430.1 hypothetical protein DMY87_19015 [Rhizobium wuzhouense]